MKALVYRQKNTLEREQINQAKQQRDILMR
jgi:hypothetical protein